MASREPQDPSTLNILQQAVENTNEAFVTIDDTHRVIFYNRAAHRIFGYAPEEVLGEDLQVIMAPDCARNHKEAVARYVRERIPRRIGHETEIQATRKGGETFPASISFSVTELGGRLFFTAIVRDLTETKALQEQLLRSERLAALGQVVAEITHEIKNPLMMIGGFARQLREAAKDPKTAKKLEIILKETVRLENLLGDLRSLYVSRVNRDARADLRSMLQEIALMIREGCRNRHIAVHLKAPGEGPVWVAGDGKKLRQVFLNLTKNALEAMEQGGQLTLELKPAGSEVEVRVADTGCGVSDAHKAKVFDPFFTTKPGGSGLGLAVSRRLVEEHGGRLKLESWKGKGTTVTVRFPASQGPDKTEDSQG